MSTVLCTSASGAHTLTGSNDAHNELYLGLGGSSDDVIRFNFNTASTVPNSYSTTTSTVVPSLQIIGKVWTFSGNVENDQGVAEIGAISGKCTCTN
jgi:hypothetical protein